MARPNSRGVARIYDHLDHLLSCQQLTYYFFDHLRRWLIIFECTEDDHVFGRGYDDHLGFFDHFLWLGLCWKAPKPAFGQTGFA
jgi:hypothetical protein